jgi:hypothetical protein
VDALEQDFAAGRLDGHEPPCLSLYQSTHRTFPENEQDPIRYRNLLRDLEGSLRERFPAADADGLLAPFQRLANDADFWNHALDGLAVLGAKDAFHVYRLQRPVPERVVVADRLYTKPLIRVLQSADRFQVLGISRGSMRLFEGNRDAVDEIEPADEVPRTMTDALGEDVTEPHLTVASYEGTGGTPGATAHHGHGGKDAEVDVDAERYFRAVDRTVLEHHSKRSELPLILAALPEHHHRFRALSHNPFLVEEGVETNPDALALDDLAERAWAILEPRYLADMAKLAERFGTARAQGLGDDDVEAVAEAAVKGRVETLLVEDHRAIPGRVDTVTGEVQRSAPQGPVFDDVLDDLVSVVQEMSGRVLIVPTEQMPTDTGVAAIYRY